MALFTWDVRRARAEKTRKVTSPFPFLGLFENVFVRQKNERMKWLKIFNKINPIVVSRFSLLFCCWNEWKYLLASKSADFYFRCGYEMRWNASRSWSSDFVRFQFGGQLAHFSRQRQIIVKVRFRLTVSINSRWVALTLWPNLELECPPHISNYNCNNSIWIFSEMSSSRLSLMHYTKWPETKSTADKVRRLFWFKNSFPHSHSIALFTIVIIISSLYIYWNAFKWQWIPNDRHEVKEEIKYYWHLVLGP